MFRRNHLCGSTSSSPLNIGDRQDLSCPILRRVVLPAALAAAAIFVGPIGTATAADIVSQKSNGRSTNGEVTQITKDLVTVKALSKTVEIPANDVAAIKWDDEPAKLNVIRSDERGGRFSKALDGYEEMQKSISSPSLGLKADLEYGVAFCTAQLALQSGAGVAEAITKLEAFQKGNAQSYHYYESADLLGQLYASQRDWEQAASSYAELEKSTVPEYKMAAKIGNGNLMLARDDGDPAAAAAEFAAVIDMEANTPGEKVKRQEAISGKVSCLIREQKFAEALELLDQILSDVTITDDDVLANAYIQQGKCHIAAGELKLAVLSFLHVDTLFSKVQPAHAEALYHLSQLWPKVGKPERGEEDRKRLDTDYPNSRWAKQLSGN